MDGMFFLIALLVYAVATLHYLIFLVSERKILATVASFATYTGFVIHTMGVGNLLIASHQIAGRNLISVFAWAVVLVYIFVELKYKLEIFGSFVIPLAFLLIVFASVLPQEVAPALNATANTWKMLHILCAFVGYGAFAIVFVTAVMYLFQEKQLKSKKLGLMYHRLPSLEVLDKVGYNCLVFGFPFLTFGIIIGVIWAGIVRHSFINWRMKEVWWVFIWIVYGILLHARVSVGWKGKHAAYMAIAAFVVAYIILVF